MFKIKIFFLGGWINMKLADSHVSTRDNKKQFDLITAFDIFNCVDVG